MVVTRRQPSMAKMLLSEAAIRIGKRSPSCAAARELCYLRAALFGSRAIGVRRRAPIHAQPSLTRWDAPIRSAELGASVYRPQTRLISSGVLLVRNTTNRDTSRIGCHRSRQRQPPNPTAAGSPPRPHSTRHGHRRQRPSTDAAGVKPTAHIGHAGGAACCIDAALIGNAGL
jgi:hypothetical protein